MDLYSQCFHIARPIGAACEVGQVELNLVPAFIQTHWHSTDKGLYPRCALEVACSEAPTNILVIQDLNFKCEIFLHILDNHDEKRKSDAQRLSRIGGARDESCADVCAQYFEHEGLDIVVRDPFDVAISNLLIPDLKWFASDAVQYRQKPTLKCVFKHA